MNRKPLFIECNVCGERWKAATLPLSVRNLPKMLTCPNCGEKDKIGFCPTDGANAVTEPRDGKVIEDD